MVSTKSQQRLKQLSKSTQISQISDIRAKLSVCWEIANNLYSTSNILFSLFINLARSIPFGETQYKFIQK